MKRDEKRLLLLREYWVDSQPLLESRLVQLIGSKDETKDILQKSAIIAVEQFDPDAIPDSAVFLRWIWARAKWLTLDRIAERKKWVDLPEQLSDETPADVLAGKQLWRKLIDGLPPQQQQVARLKIEGYGSVEIARKLGKNPASVRSNWRHARSEMLSQLEDYVNE